MKKHLISIDPVYGFIVANFGGQLTVNDLLSFFGDLKKHKDYRPTYLTIYDCKLSSAIGYRIDVISFVEHLRKRNWDSRRRKIGFIVGSSNQRFLIRTFMDLIKGLNFDVEMFENKKLCLKWVSDNLDIRNKMESSINLNRSILYDQLKAEIFN